MLINGKRFSSLLDTGADISVITASQWPSKWPKTETITQLKGIGQIRNPEYSSNELHWKDEEDHEGTFKPYIISYLPVNLWGQDIMSRMGVYLYSPSMTVTNQMFQKGLLSNQGLGKNNKGKVDPVIPDSRPPGAELGTFKGC